MNLNELSKRILEAVGEEAPPKLVLQKAAGEIKAALRQGKTVDLLGLIRVSLSPLALEGKVRTGPKALVATPLPGLLALGSRAPAKEKAHINVILAVAKQDPFIRILAKKLEKENRTVDLMDSAEAVIGKVKEGNFDVVVMDLAMEMSEEVRLWLKSNPERSMISLIALYPVGAEPDKVEAFRICEDEVLVEPFEPEDLDEMIGVEVRRIAEERKYFRHEISYQFPAQGIYQHQAADMMEKLTAKSGLTEEGQMGLVVAFREAVDNAIRHGSKNKRNAPVTVAYVLDYEKVTVTIRDEGPGFDSSVYLETRVSGDAVKIARARHREGRRGGLGIMLMLKSVDKLEYNRAGNVAKLTKYLPAQNAGVA